MCGIAGVVSPKRASERAVRAMNGIQAHRGPDGEGVWRSPSGICALGHRRLSILDLSPAGAQPMVDEASGLAITYNGEIYNYVELRERLESCGHQFRTHTDTEVLLRAYVEWGEACLSELNGMFAFAVWDERKRTLFCARDRFGEKPFHYSVDRDTFAFASEAKALALLDMCSLELDIGTLAAYIAVGSTALDAGERTLLAGVRQLLPGQAMLVVSKPEGLEIARRWTYFEVDLTARHAYGVDNADASAERLLALLRDSIRLRLRSDVRVGSCLSGGLDSSAVVALMRRLEPEMEIRTFTGRFIGHPLDEGPFAKLAADACRTSVHEVAPTAERFAHEAERLYWHADFPIGGTSQFAQYCVFQLAKEHDTTVLLDGQGSDEQLGGYGNEITASFLRQLAVEHRWSAFAFERRAAARTHPRVFSWPKLLLNETSLARLSPVLRAYTNRYTLTRRDLYKNDVAEATPREVILPFAVGSERTSLSRTLWLLSFRTMLSSLLRFGDRLSMAHSREVRLPFCDHRVTEFVFSLSPELLVGEGEVKRVLRKAIRNLVPTEISTRRKQGFVPPQTSWLLDPLAGWTRELAANNHPLADYMEVGRVRKLVDSSRETRQREITAVWEASNLMAWSHFAWERMRRTERVSASD